MLADSTGPAPTISGRGLGLALDYACAGMSRRINLESRWYAHSWPALGAFRGELPKEEIYLGLSVERSGGAHQTRKLVVGLILNDCPEWHGYPKQFSDRLHAVIASIREQDVFHELVSVLVSTCPQHVLFVRVQLVWYCLRSRLSSLFLPARWGP